MNLIPTFDRIIVKPDKPELTKGGLYIPDTVKDKAPKYTGKVVAVGLGRHDSNGIRIEMSIKVGDIVLYPRTGLVKYVSDSDKCAGNEYDIMQETNVLAVVKSE